MENTGEMFFTVVTLNLKTLTKSETKTDICDKLSNSANSLQIFYFTTSNVSLFLFA